MKRTITGAVYVAIIIGFFLLRDYVDYRLFDLLIFAFCAIGTFEIARAIKPYIYKGNFTLAVCFGVAFTPIFCAAEYLTGFGGAFVCLVLSLVAVAYQVVLAAVKEKNVNGANFKKTARAFAVNALPFVYPALFLLTVLISNGFAGIKGFVCLLLIFVIPPCSDTFAYLVGMSYGKIRKGKAKKLCPRLSPNKTWAGAIGGILGGVLGALVLYFIVDTAALSQDAKVDPFIVFMLVGLLASVLTEIGDLFESFIKRKVGIKDMGRIMPGHGGVMDRIDGTLFAAVFIFLAFLLLT